MTDKNIKTVYFLGAGASKASDFSLPIMREFFRKKDFSGGDFANLKTFINKIKPFSELGSVDIEDIITYLDLSLEDLGLYLQHERVLERKARQELDAYIQMRFTPKQELPYVCELHKKLAQRLAEGDSVLTLNYDLIMDLAINFRKSGASLLTQDEMLVRSYALLGDVPLAQGYLAHPIS